MLYGINRHGIKNRGLCNASIILATGLSIKWLRKQRESFKVYPQGFSAVAEKLADFKGVNILSDIGNGTMNILFIVDGIPSESKSILINSV